jgi:hypothetical protein
MAEHGYSGTPLPKKLGIRDGHRVVVVAAPSEFTLDAEYETTLRSKAEANVIVVFAKTQAELEKRFVPAIERLETAGGLWVAWPKKSSGVATDLDENKIRAFGLGIGLVDNKVCAIDGTWSGLRFVRRLKDRPKPPARSAKAR